jgi:hypothetical protein
VILEERFALEVTVRPRTLLSVAVLTAICLAPAAARAQERAGARAGVSSDPTQFYFGGHFETRPLVEQLSFRPNVEVGLGDDSTLVALNFEFVYGIPLPDRSPWRVYLGGGPALNVRSFWESSPRRGEDSDTGGGFNLLVGLEHRDGLFAEVKVGIIDSPGFKFAVGYNFKR